MIEHSNNIINLQVQTFSLFIGCCWYELVGIFIVGVGLCGFVGDGLFGGEMGLRCGLVIGVR